MSGSFEFPKDEIKKEAKWQRGSDFMDGSSRYTFEGRDPQNTLERFQVVIYSEREREYPHDPTSRKTFYYGYVRDNEKECADTIGRFSTLKEAKTETLDLFNEYMSLFASQSQNEQAGVSVVGADFYYETEDSEEDLEP